ncbi:hypothetical protein FACS1894123_03780 [Bacteroidia bacterium]|nr:hypothetical protein FACS1894123_03780 [Bacteroidia bacterium]
MSFIVEQKIKGRIYLYQVDSYWDKTAKKAKQKRKYLGAKDRVQKPVIKPVISHINTKNYGNILLLESILQTLGLRKINVFIRYIQVARKYWSEPTGKNIVYKKMD